MDAFAWSLLLVGLGFVAAMGRSLTERFPAEPPTPTGIVPSAMPPQVSPLVGGHLTRYRRRSATAQIADWVLRGVIRLDPTRPTRIEVTDATRLDPAEHALLRALLDAEPRLGVRADLSAEDRPTAWRVRDAQDEVNRHMLDAGLRYGIGRPASRWWLRGLILASAALAVWPATQDPRGWFAPAVLLAFGLLDPSPARHWPLTARGVELRDRLLQVQDWLRFGTGPADLTSLYPWAVLFGQLDRWRERAGTEDPTLRALMVALGGDRDGHGYADELPGDAWGEQATGGSTSEYHGATRPVTD